jgi:hypothetical protein
MLSKGHLMSVDRKFAPFIVSSEPRSRGNVRFIHQLAYRSLGFFKDLDQESACTPEQSLLLGFVALVFWAFAPLFWLGGPGVCSSILVPTRGAVATEALSESHAHTQKHHRIRELAERLRLSEESIRQLVKDEPGVVKIRQGRKAAHTSYSVPESVAIKIYVRLGGEASSFDDEHYRIADVAPLWKIGREKVRLLIKDEPGVIKLSLGSKGARLTYSVPDSVLERIHNRLLYTA